MKTHTQRLKEHQTTNHSHMPTHPPILLNGRIILLFFFRWRFRLIDQQRTNGLNTSCLAKTDWCTRKVPGRWWFSFRKKPFCIMACLSNEEVKSLRGIISSISFGRVAKLYIIWRTFSWWNKGKWERPSPAFLDFLFFSGSSKKNVCSMFPWVPQMSQCSCRNSWCLAIRWFS